jgi:hypothetical protein
MRCTRAIVPPLEPPPTRSLATCVAIIPQAQRPDTHCRAPPCAQPLNSDLAPPAGGISPRRGGIVGALLLWPFIQALEKPGSRREGEDAVGGSACRRYTLQP